jgi:hypothetical protein
MRRMRLGWIAVSILLGGWLTGANGQFVGVVGSAGAGPANGAYLQPYSATQKTTTVQKLLDGTTITRASTTKMARDSQGRTYQENRMDENVPIPGRTVITSFSVNDPVARVSLSWNSQNKEVVVFHFPEIKPRPTQPARVVTRAALPDASMRPKTQQEKLGSRTIAGVYAEGTRTTTTYPIGFYGNDRPLVVVQERWTSPDLRMEVMNTTDDPRMGVQTMEMTEIDRSEPNPALFQAPEGYAVRDRNPDGN